MGGGWLLYSSYYPGFIGSKGVGQLMDSLGILYKSRN